MDTTLSPMVFRNFFEFLSRGFFTFGYLLEVQLNVVCFKKFLLTPEPNGVGEGVYEIGRVLRRRRDAVCVWTL